MATKIFAAVSTVAVSAELKKALTGRAAEFANTETEDWGKCSCFGQTTNCEDNSSCKLVDEDGTEITDGDGYSVSQNVSGQGKRDHLTGMTSQPANAPSKYCIPKAQWDVTNGNAKMNLQRARQYYQCCSTRASRGSGSHWDYSVGSGHCLVAYCYSSCDQYGSDGLSGR